jgi:hypothetical protein
VVARSLWHWYEDGPRTLPFAVMTLHPGRSRGSPTSHAKCKVFSTFCEGFPRRPRGRCQRFIFGTFGYQSRFWAFFRGRWYQKKKREEGGSAVPMLAVP